MSDHNGMRPQDIVILLKIISYGNNQWYNKNLAQDLFISQSEVSESLNRSVIACLISPDKNQVMRQSLYDFIAYGLHYVYPQAPGAIVRGIPTAHSHVFMAKFFESETIYVWPDAESNIRGAAIQPLYPNVVKAVKTDEQLYKMLALIDAVRIGKAREIKIALEELKNMIVVGL